MSTRIFIAGVSMSRQFKPSPYSILPVRLHLELPDGLGDLTEDGSPITRKVPSLTTLTVVPPIFTASPPVVVYKCSRRSSSSQHPIGPSGRPHRVEPQRKARVPVRKWRLVGWFDPRGQRFE